MLIESNTETAVVLVGFAVVCDEDFGFEAKMVYEVVDFPGDLEVVSGFDGAFGERFESGLVFDEFFVIFVRDHNAAFVTDIVFNVFVFLMFIAMLRRVDFCFYFNEYAIISRITSGTDFFLEINPIDGLSDKVIIIIIEINVQYFGFMIAVFLHITFDELD